MTRDLREHIEDAVHAFESQWGNLEHTVDVTLWETGGYQIEVYHSAGSFGLEPAKAVRRISTLREPDGSMIHREYMWRPSSIQGDPIRPDDHEAADP